MYQRDKEARADNDGYGNQPHAGETVTPKGYRHPPAETPAAGEDRGLDSLAPALIFLPQAFALNFPGTLAPEFSSAAGR